MSVTPRSTLRQRLFAFLAAGIGGTLAAAMSFAMTVYEAANPDIIPNVEAGSPIDTGRWIVTIREARAGDVPPTGVFMASCLFEPDARFDAQHAQVAPLLVHIV
jgi:hypothetical protein